MFAKIFILLFIVFLFLLVFLPPPSVEQINLYYEDKKDAEIDFENNELVLYHFPNLENLKFKKSIKQMSRHKTKSRLFVKKTDSNSSIFVLSKNMDKYLNPYYENDLVLSNIDLMSIKPINFNKLKFIEINMEKSQAILISSDYFVFLEDENDFVYKYV